MEDAAAALEPVCALLQAIAAPTSVLPSAIFASTLFKHDPTGFLSFIRHILTALESASANLCAVKSVLGGRYHVMGLGLIQFAAFANSTLRTLPSEKARVVCITTHLASIFGAVALFRYVRSVVLVVMKRIAEDSGIVARDDLQGHSLKRMWGAILKLVGALLRSAPTLINNYQGNVSHNSGIVPCNVPNELHHSWSLSPSTSPPSSHPWRNSLVLLPSSLGL